MGGRQWGDGALRSRHRQHLCQPGVQNRERGFGRCDFTNDRGWPDHLDTTAGTYCRRDGSLCSVDAVWCERGRHCQVMRWWDPSLRQPEDDEGAPLFVCLLVAACRLRSADCSTIPMEEGGWSWRASHRVFMCVFVCVCVCACACASAGCDRRCSMLRFWTYWARTCTMACTLWFSSTSVTWAVAARRFHSNSHQSCNWLGRCCWTRRRKCLCMVMACVGVCRSLSVHVVLHTAPPMRRCDGGLCFEPNTSGGVWDSMWGAARFRQAVEEMK